MKIKATLLLSLLVCTCSYAQLSKNPNKFLGNITTSYSVSNDFSNYWNQLTPENETKWASIEGTRDVYTWDAVDREYQYCKDHNIPFKFHTLVWGSQYPKWMDDLSQNEQTKEITEWMDTVARKYPDLEYIDVVNEALSGHAPAPFKNALGGDGVSGYDWIVKAFIMARERWPKAVLIYNDFNTFQWDTDRFIDLIKKIVAAGAPVDAAGCQSHDLNDMSGADFKTVLEKVHNQTGLPIFISEYDINQEDDQVQLTRFKEQIPIMWEADYVAGVTLWGYIYGSTWVDYSGLIKNGVERPALKWLRDYMASDVAINAKSPITKVRKYAYISAPAMVKINSEVIIKARAYSEEDNLSKVQIYVNGSLLCDTTESSFDRKWNPTTADNYTLTMKVFNDANSLIFEKSCTVRVYEPSTPYNEQPIALPGTIEAEDFDKGANGVAYSDVDNSNTGGKYRTDCGVDIDGLSGGGYFVGWTSAGEWLEYTVKVDEEQFMVWSAKVASGMNGAAFRIYMGETDITGKISVPLNTVYTEIKGRTKVKMPVGTYTLRLVIEGAFCTIDKVTFDTSTGNEIFTTPYNGSPFAIPGTVEAELYDKGSEEVAYKDSDSKNEGDASFRTDFGVDIVYGNGGKALGYTAVGEWLLYTVNIANETVYDWSAYVSSGTTGAAFRIYMGDTDITGVVQIPKTADNSWDTYTKVSGKTSVALPAGIHQLKLVIEGANGNIDRITFSQPLGIDDIKITKLDGVYELFSVMGISYGIVEISNGDISKLQDKYPTGVYILRKKDGSEETRRIFITRN